MLCDQVLWAPFFSCVFFAVIKTLEVTHMPRSFARLFSATVSHLQLLQYTQYAPIADAKEVLFGCQYGLI